MKRYLSHNVGMIWLLQNDPEIPEPLRADALQYGWHREEWPANGHVPRKVYVRQGRRVVGDYIQNTLRTSRGTSVTRYTILRASGHLIMDSSLVGRHPVRYCDI